YGRRLLVFRDGHGGLGAFEREISNCRGPVTLPLIPVPCVDFKPESERNEFCLEASFPFQFSDIGKKSSTDLQPCRELSVHSWRSLRTCSVIQSGRSWMSSFSEKSKYLRICRCVTEIGTRLIPEL
ncbi:hypothetical protein LINPERPRIM_LOCUS28601, partial [Linum perenne]